MNPQMGNAHRLATANVFACKAHANKFRDDGKTPYAVHPVRVTEYLRRLAKEIDEDVLCAALLHDTIEDSAVTFDTIAAQFGDDVAVLVAELTNDNRLPKTRRRAQMMEHLKDLSPRAKRIKLADRLDNVSDLIRGFGTAEKRTRYAEETQRLLNACEGACEPLEKALRELLAELCEMNKQLLDKS